MNKIKEAFLKKAFIAFLTAGDPTLDKTKDYIKQIEKAGASLIEIGIPFSDPIAEGPTIQEANVRALKNKVTTDDVFDMVEELDVNIPLCFMTYLNVVFHYGYDKFFQRCNKAKISGIIIPDLPYEESNEVKEVAKKYNVCVISMVAPTSKERVETIVKDAQGFIYLVSSMGVTGVRGNQSFASGLDEIVKMIKDNTDTPVAIGFGIHNKDQAKEISLLSDGVIVGSAIVNIIAKYGDNADDEIYNYVKEMVDSIS